jgi:hypothetical protein
MKFKNIAYLVKDSTRNNTNTKNYSQLKDDFIFEASYKYVSKYDGNVHEECVLGRTGYKFGIYVQESETLIPSNDVFSNLNNTVKWCWFRQEGDVILYEDLFFAPDGTPEKNQAHLTWWKEFIKKQSPVYVHENIVEGLAARWGMFDSKMSLDQISDPILSEWAKNIEEGKKRVGSYITEDVIISVVKENNKFKLFINDIFYCEKEIGNVLDYSNGTICIGIDDPYKDVKKVSWFTGEIHYIKIYNSSKKSDHTLYSWLDFAKKTQFKVFDLSRNGNHGEIYETDELKYLKNEEFRAYSRPAKII